VTKENIKNLEFGNKTRRGEPNLAHAGVLMCKKGQEGGATGLSGGRGGMRPGLKCRGGQARGSLNLDRGEQERRWIPARGVRVG